MSRIQEVNLVKTVAQHKLVVVTWSEDATKNLHLPRADIGNLVVSRRKILFSIFSGSTFSAIDYILCDDTVSILCTLASVKVRLMTPP